MIIKMKKMELDLEKIRELYLNKKKTIKEISKIFNVSPASISRRLKKMNVKLRLRKYYGWESNKVDLDLEKVKGLYFCKNKTIKQIAKIFNVGETTIFSRLNKLGVIKRKGELIKIKLDFDKIRDLYINQKKPATEIGRILGVSYMTIINRLKENNVKMRGVSETNKRLYKEGKIKAWNDGLTKETDEKLKRLGEKTGKTLKRLHKEGKIKIWNKDKSMIHSGSFKKAEEHHNFNNWSSREPYGKEFSPELREQIRIRDNHTCQECEKTQKELFKRCRNGKVSHYKLHIHHIDYNKENNNPLNLISLCNKCHMKTGFDRKHWKRCFKERMVLKQIFNPENLLVFKDKKLIGINQI